MRAGTPGSARSHGVRSAFPRGANERLHVIQITLERATPGGSQGVARPGYPPLEAFVARDVVRFLELARVDAEVAIRGLHQPLEVVEAQRVVHGERAHDAEAQPLVNQPVEAERAFLAPALAADRAQPAGTLAFLGNGAVFSHRVSAR